MIIPTTPLDLAYLGTHHLRVFLLQLCASVRLVVEGALVLVGVAMQTAEQVLTSAFEPC